MANYDNLIASIKDSIKNNNKQAITGQVLQDTLLDIVSQLGKNYAFGGVATPSTNPGTPTTNTFYIATEAGTYTKMGGVVLNASGLYAIIWDGDKWLSTRIADNVTAKDIQTLDSKIIELVGGIIEIEGEKKEGNLNISGLITSIANNYYYEYNIEELRGKTIKVSSTCNNKYVTLWSLSANMLVAGEQSVILGKSGVTSVIREDTIDLSQYPTAKYLYIGTFEPTAVAKVYTENDGEIAEIRQSLANVAETANNAKVSADNINATLNPSTALTPIKNIGYLNTSGTISTTGYRDSYNIEDFKDCILEVSTTLQNKYVTLWALFSDEPVAGDANPPRIAKGELTSVMQSDTIDLSQYPSAKILVMGTYTESDTSLVKTTKNIINDLTIRVNSLEHNENRGRIDILKTDSEIEILTKMIQADEQGNTDVYWENGVYQFSSMYLYMRDTLGWTITLGLPIGHNNRYFFNNSTLISTQPSDLEHKIDVLATRNSNGNLEVHDVTIVNNGGKYCIHDEAGSSEMAYDHKYFDVICKYNGTNKPFGCGTGYNATISFVRCMMFTNSDDRIIAVHGPVNNTTNKKVVLKFSMVNCYLEKSQIGFNASTFDGTRDDLLLFMCGCRAKEVFSDSRFTTIAYNNIVD